MNARFFTLALSLSILAGGPDVASAASKQECSITRPSDKGFVPPQPLKSVLGNGEFFYGTAALWTIVYPDWHIHSGGKLPFFRLGYDWMREKDPRLAVVARRLPSADTSYWL